ncbi:MAG TPA: peptide deformylase, partial [Candidatus Cloacimonadota bacterium]|nr:peptide deformylase [Candidatus Cloacimonadota bacterium]
MKAKLLQIRLVGDKILRQVAEPVQEITPEMKNFLKDLTHTMYETDGVGLAAPQVGLSQRIFVIDTTWSQEEGKKEPIVLINPVILESSGELIYEEGCLSVPGIFEKVKRFNHIVMEYQDINGEKRTLEGEGTRAVVMQHEYDHLDGILFIDKITKLKLWPLKKKIRQFESSTD